MDKQIRNAKGEGSFKWNQDGTITHRKSVGYKANGHRKIITITAATKSACIKLMRQREAEWSKQKKASEVLARDTVAELCFKHLSYQVENDELKSKSIDRRESTIVNQIESYSLGKAQVGTVLPTDIEKHILLLIKESKLSESSITKALDVLNAAFAWAVLRGELDSNPVEFVKLKLVKRLKKMKEKSANEADVDVMSEEEIELFIREALKVDSRGQRVYPAGDYLLLLLYTGMRCGEMLALRWSDWNVNFLTIKKSASMAKNRNKSTEDDNNYVMVEGTPKNQKARNIQLSEEAIDTLKRIQENSKWVQSEDLITPTLSGKQNTASNLEHRFKIVLKNAGLIHVKGGLHTLRKTAATQLYEAGARMEDIAAYIGDLESTTRKYYVSIRKKTMTKDGLTQIVKLPKGKNEMD